MPSERTGGRGLLLPAALASAWGVAYGRASKAVWFRLALDGASGEPGAGPGGDGDAASELAERISSIWQNRADVQLARGDSRLVRQMQMSQMREQSLARQH